MSDNVTLTAAVRTSLLSLNNTSSLVKRTQNRLSTGLKVSGPVDDAVSYFQAKGLSDRAADFSEKKSGIDQGVSTLSTALNGINGVESLVKQLKGLSLNAKTATSTQITGLVSQFNDLRTQIANLTSDTSYQGLNLINGSGQTLRVDFSDQTASTLSVVSVDVTVGAKGLNIAKAITNNGGFQISYDNNTGVVVGCGSTIEVTYSGTQTTYSAGTYTFSYGDATLSVVVGSANATTTSFTDTSTFTVGNTYVFRLGSASSLTSGDEPRALVSRTAQTFDVEFAVNTGAYISTAGGNSIVVNYNGTQSTFSQGSYTFAYGDVTLTVSVGSVGSTSTTYTETSAFYQSGASLTLTVLSTGNSTTAAGVAAVSASGTVTSASVFNVAGAYLTDGTAAGVTQIHKLVTTFNAGAAVTNAAMSGQFYLDSNLVGQINTMLTKLDDALSTLRSRAQTLGSNVALLQARLDFTTNYVDTLTAGSSKLTLADLNEEGANLLALQTRQQLGIQALSFAGQAEQSVLSLFR